MAFRLISSNGILTGSRQISQVPKATGFGTAANKSKQPKKKNSESPNERAKARNVEIALEVAAAEASRRSAQEVAMQMDQLLSDLDVGITSSSSDQKNSDQAHTIDLEEFRAAHLNKPNSDSFSETTLDDLIKLASRVKDIRQQQKQQQQQQQSSLPMESLKSSIISPMEDDLNDYDRSRDDESKQDQESDLSTSVAEVVSHEPTTESVAQTTLPADVLADLFKFAEEELNSKEVFDEGESFTVEIKAQEEMHSNDLSNSQQLPSQGHEAPSGISRFKEAIDLANASALSPGSPTSEHTMVPSTKLHRKRGEKQRRSADAGSLLDMSFGNTSLGDSVKDMPHLDPLEDIPHLDPLDKTNTREWTQENGVGHIQSQEVTNAAQSLTLVSDQHHDLASALSENRELKKMAESLTKQLEEERRKVSAAQSSAIDAAAATSGIMSRLLESKDLSMEDKMAFVQALNRITTSLLPS